MKSIIFIDRNNLYYYGGNVHTIIAMAFSKTAVSDLEIIDKDELEKQISEWVTAQKIEPTTAIIVFPPSCYFQKEIPLTTPPEQLDSIKKEFLANIPFNETLTQEFTLAKSTIMTVINKRFAYTLRDIFRSLNFKVESIAPTTELYGAQQITSFTPSIAQDALKKINRDSSFSIDEVEQITQGPMYDAPQTPPSNNRLYIMLGVFAVLLAVLGGVYFMNKKPTKKTVVTITPVPLQQTIPVPEATESAVISPTSSLTLIAKDELTIQVLNGSGVAGQADEIKSRLEEKTFDNITTGDSPVLQSAKTLVVFKPEVAEKDRKDIINIIEFYVEEVSVQEKNDIETDVLITTSTPAISPTP